MDTQALRRALGSVATLPVICTIVLGSGLVAADDDHKSKRGKAEALLRNTAGEIIGRVRFLPRGSNVSVAIRVWNVTPGFHGLHVHAIGECDPSTGFLSAGAHFDRPAGVVHGGHAGDLPSLLVHADGSADATVVTDRFRIAELFDADGSAVILHALPDNFAHIPSRYVSNGPVPSGYTGGPDPLTLATGDAGSRVGCGVVR
jgi:superoxide dismutase, Cu-Zn family